MKIKNYIATLLVIYMIALMLLPCSDACSSHQHNIPSNVQTAQDYHQADEDVCSPFCFCSCCATPMTIYHLQTFGFIPHLTVQDFSTIELAFICNAEATIWQPPKLS
jgi:hypothetical protein